MVLSVISFHVANFAIDLRIVVDFSVVRGAFPNAEFLAALLFIFVLSVIRPVVATLCPVVKMRDFFDIIYAVSCK